MARYKWVQKSQLGYAEQSNAVTGTDHLGNAFVVIAQFALGGVGYLPFHRDFIQVMADG